MTRTAPTAHGNRPVFSGGAIRNKPTEPTTTTDTLAAKQLIHKIQV
jgi:hypothetical protein